MTRVLSVVIPTRNRQKILMTTLRALAVQRGLDGGLEVIVTDDGSVDGSVELLRGSAFEAFDFHLLALDAGGPARARNRAIAEASADRVLVLGDDTVPTPNALAVHMRMAGNREVAVQGRIEWDPDHPVTDFMSYLAPAGPQFWFRGLADGGPVGWTQILGSNLSAPTRWFRLEAYDERFSDACMEDTELAYRWHRRGWTAVWSDRALCYHRHRYDDAGPFLDRQRRAGHWARLAVSKNPGMIFKVVAQPLLTTPWKAVRTVGRRLIGRADQVDRWDLQCRAAFFRGFFLGL